MLIHVVFPIFYLSLYDIDRFFFVPQIIKLGEKAGTSNKHVNRELFAYSHFSNKHVDGELNNIIILMFIEFK